MWRGTHLWLVEVWFIFVGLSNTLAKTEDPENRAIFHYLPLLSTTTGAKNWRCNFALSLYLPIEIAARQHPPDWKPEEIGSKVAYLISSIEKDEI